MTAEFPSSPTGLAEQIEDAKRSIAAFRKASLTALEQAQKGE
jgi:hypothetical protein